MKKIIFIVFFIVLIIPQVFAICEEDQININTASLEELTNIIYIGEARAEQLSSLRPFESVEDLIKIKGIGEVYLGKIKTQGLACVEEKTEDKEETKQEEFNEILKVAQDNFSLEDSVILENPVKEVQIQNPKIIKLNAQTIKSSEDNENLEKSKKNLYIKYGFVGLSMIIGFLFLLKKHRVNKSEFKR